MELTMWTPFASVDPDFFRHVKFALTVGCTAGHDYIQQEGGLMVMQNGEVFAVGGNVFGCLGVPGIDCTYSPVKVDALCGQDVQDLAAGFAHVVALTSSGRVLTWGNNEFCQLGQDILNEKVYFAPTELQGELGKQVVIAVACGSYHTLALTNKGEVYGWGKNKRGRVGVVGRTRRSRHGHPVVGTPTKIIFPVKNCKIKAIACGRDFSAALSDQGKIFTWGSNKYGQLGTKFLTSEVGPQKVQASLEFKQVKCGASHCIALTRKSRVYFWGRNWDETITKPMRVAKGVEGITDIAASHLLPMSAVKASSGVFVWGQCSRIQEYSSNRARSLVRNYLLEAQLTGYPSIDVAFAVHPEHPVMSRAFRFDRSQALIPRRWSFLTKIQENLRPLYRPVTQPASRDSETNHEIIDLPPVEVSDDDCIHMIPPSAITFFDTELDTESQMDVGSESDCIGEGSTAEVFRGSYAGREVAIKRLRGGGGHWKKILRRELRILSAIENHENVVNFVGAAKVDNALHESLGEMLILTEYCELRDLKTFLVRRRDYFYDELQFTSVIKGTNFTSTASSPYVQINCTDGSIKTRDLINWAVQFAAGMAYLASKNIIHGDLALRNLLLTNSRILKVSDFGLSRRIQGKEYYRIYNGESIPWASTAPETLKYMKLTTASDVWGFGITLWEMFSLGETPFTEFTTYSTVPFDSSKFSSAVENGHRLPKPKYASTAIYEIMDSCWALDPALRPSFSHLKEQLERLYQSFVEEIDT